MIGDSLDGTAGGHDIIVRTIVDKKGKLEKSLLSEFLKQPLELQFRSISLKDHLDRIRSRKLYEISFSYSILVQPRSVPKPDIILPLCQGRIEFGPWPALHA